MIFTTRSLFPCAFVLASFIVSSLPASSHAARPVSSQTKGLPKPLLMSRTKYQRLQANLPEVDDPRIQQILSDPRLILYTNQEIPPAYQDWCC